MRPTTLALALSVASLLACSGRGDDVASEPPPDGTPVDVARLQPRPLPAGSSLMLGEWAFATTHLGRAVNLGLRIDEASVTRITRGAETATEALVVVEDGPGRVVLELRPEGEPAKRRELLFDGPDTLFDSAAPELRYSRTAGPADEGSGDEPPSDDEAPAGEAPAEQAPTTGG